MSGTPATGTVNAVTQVTATQLWFGSGKSLLFLDIEQNVWTDLRKELMLSARSVVKGQRAAEMRLVSGRIVQDTECLEDYYLQASQSWANPVFPPRDMCTLRIPGCSAMAQTYIKRRGFGEIPML